MQEWWLAVDISAWGHNLISQGIPRIGGFSFIANITYTKFKEALHTESLVEKFPLINCKTITKLRAVFSSSFINLDRLEITSIRRKLIRITWFNILLSCMHVYYGIYSICHRHESGMAPFLLRRLGLRFPEIQFLCLCKTFLYPLNAFKVLTKLKWTWFLCSS